MRRSFCFCEPNVALAGNTSDWKFVYTTANHLPKGAKVRFDLESKGRPVDWQIPSVNVKEKNNVIWAEITGGKAIPAHAAQNPQTKAPAFEFTIPSELKPGDTISIFIKDNAAQKSVQRRRAFQLFIDPKGKGDYKDNETFYLDVRGNELKNLRVIAPSLVARNKRFDVIVRFEDVYGNLTSNAPEGTLIDLSYQHLRENLNWKLFVPETGFIALPNLYFNEPGIYKIQLNNLTTKEQFFSPPIKCLPEGSPSLYWGSFHGESERVDSAEHIEAFLRHMRDDKALQFFATSCFDSEQETSNDIWKGIVQQVAEFNEDDRFVAMLGFQWQGENKEEGIRQFVYSKDAKPIMRQKDTKNNSLKKIFKTNNPKELVAIPTFTMGKTSTYNFEDFNPEFEKVVEIYNAWGSSECTAKEGNKRPIKGKQIGEAAEGSVQKALNNGCRFGFTAGGFDDRGIYGDLYDTDQAQYTPGLTAILAKEHNRSSLFESIQARSCYASTGERIILGFHIAGFPMGSEIETKTRPGLEYNRHLTGYCIGTAPITEAVIIRNGKEFRSLEVKEGIVEFEIDDTDMLGTVAFGEKGEKPPFAYYYLRATQEDGHMAWSSPIWVDLTRSVSSAPVKKTKKKG